MINIMSKENPRMLHFKSREFGRVKSFDVRNCIFRRWERSHGYEANLSARLLSVYPTQLLALAINLLVHPLSIFILVNLRCIFSLDFMTFSRRGSVFSKKWSQQPAIRFRTCSYCASSCYTFPINDLTKRVDILQVYAEGKCAAVIFCGLGLGAIRSQFFLSGLLSCADLQKRT